MRLRHASYYNAQEIARREAVTQAHHVPRLVMTGAVSSGMSRQGITDFLTQEKKVGTVGLEEPALQLPNGEVISLR